MTRAAERLFVSQPTMSKQLKELEKELGTQLFIRSNYSIKLTEAGMLLKKRAEDILTLVDKTKDEFRSMDEINSGDIFVGAPESESMALFTDTVSDLQRDYPGIRCNIYSGNHEDVCDRLDKGLLDFAIVMSYVDLSKYNYLEIPAKDSWGILMKKSDPLASKESLTIDELKKKSSDLLTSVDRSGFPSLVRRGQRQSKDRGHLQSGVQRRGNGQVRDRIRRSPG